MKKRVFALLVTLALCVCMAVPACAQNGVYVLDELDLLTADEIDTLNSYAASLADELKVDICFVYTTAEDMEDYISQLNLGEFDDDVIMVENEGYWEIVSNLDYITADMEYDLRDVYDVEESYFGGVKAFMDAVATVVAENQKAPEEEVPAQPEVKPTQPEAQEPEKEIMSPLQDYAGLLQATEAEGIEKRLNEVGETYKVQLAIVTINSIEDMTKADFAKKVYRQMGYGYGDDGDGVLLLINMDTPHNGLNRGWYIFTQGVGYDAISNSECDQIGEAMTQDLKDGEYAEAFDTFVDKCEHQLDIHINGEPFEWTKSIVISVLVGLVIAWIVTGVMKSKLKTVRAQRAAANYVREGSMQVTEAYEFFLYSTIDRREKPKSSSSGGSSSGSRQGGSGGSF